MKKTIMAIIFIVAVVIIAIAISPAFIVKEADDPSPLQNNKQVTTQTAQTTNTDTSAPTQDKVAQETQIVEDDTAEEDMQDMMDEAAQEVVETDMEMPAQAQVIASGEFTGTTGHPVSGTAWLIDDNGQKILRFEDFSTINGPELHIYLATDTKASDYVDLGIIKATKGNVNYDVAVDIDTEKYNNVLVWCEPFGVLFGYAMI